MTERLLVQILTVDPSHQRIEGVGKDAAVIQIGVGKAPPLFVWPQQGEYWTIIRENGEWTLQSKLTGPDEQVAAAPGEAMVQAETIWTPSGERLLTTVDESILDTRLDTLETRSRSFNVTSVTTVDLGAISGEVITGVRIAVVGTLVGPAVNSFLRLQPNGLTSITTGQLGHIVYWEGSFGGHDIPFGSDFGFGTGIIIGHTDFEATTAYVTAEGTLFTRKGRYRAWNGNYSNVDFSGAQDRRVFGTFFSTWADSTTTLSSLTLAAEPGYSFTGQINLEVIP
jgi:hypothetical protein